MQHPCGCLNPVVATPYYEPCQRTVLLGYHGWFYIACCMTRIAACYGDIVYETNVLQVSQYLPCYQTMCVAEKRLPHHIFTKQHA